MDRAAQHIPHSSRSAPARYTLALFLVVCVLLSACTPHPAIRRHPELAQRKNSLQHVGLIPPTIAMFEEKAGYKLDAHPEWGKVATESVAAAFVAEARERQLPLLLLDSEQPPVAEVADLFAALDLSIVAHDYQRGEGHRSDEPFPEPSRPFIHTLGPLADLQEGEEIDGVWLIQGTNLLPTPAARLGDAGQVTMAIIVSLSGHAVPVAILDKFVLEAALVDRSGAVLFHCLIDEVARPAAEGEESVPVDLRDARYARAVVKAIFRVYRQGVAP